MTSPFLEHVIVVVSTFSVVDSSTGNSFTASTGQVSKLSTEIPQTYTEEDTVPSQLAGMLMNSTVEMFFVLFIYFLFHYLKGVTESPQTDSSSLCERILVQNFGMKSGER